MGEDESVTRVDAGRTTTLLPGAHNFRRSFSPVPLGHATLIGTGDHKELTLNLGAVHLPRRQREAHGHLPGLNE